MPCLDLKWEYSDGAPHTDPLRDVSQSELGQPFFFRQLPGGLEDLPPRCLTSFGKPIAIRRGGHAGEDRPVQSSCQAIGEREFSGTSR